MNIGFISFRFAGTDGVSLEAAKWVSVLEQQGHRCFFFAGELDTDPDRSLCVPEAHFSDPSMRALVADCFTSRARGTATTDALHELRSTLKSALYKFVRTFSLDVLVPQNILAIPMNIPLALAVTEYIAETGIPVVAHHHDFAWERQRFDTGLARDLLNYAYPPDLPSIRHVVINSIAQEQLSYRRGLQSTLVPNVMDYDQPTRQPDAYNATLRADLGIADGTTLVLQPTRVVERKGIEHAIEFVSRLPDAVLVISHAAGDEGTEYAERLASLSQRFGVRLLCADSFITDRRGTRSDGGRTYDLSDAYAVADFVTYPSLIEGFGNAFLEAVHAKKPILVNRYAVYDRDIRPLGFRVTEMQGLLTEAAVQDALQYMQQAELRREATEHNFARARAHFSLEQLSDLLTVLFRFG